MKLILFDADGTLIDSQAIIHESMRLAFSRFGYEEPDISHTRSIIGLTLDTAISTILGREIDAEILAMTQEYKDIYIQLAPREDMQSKAFEGVPEVVHDLANHDDVLLGIVTGKSRRGVERLLETNNFGRCFVVSRCADDCPSKPHPAMVYECCAQTGVSPEHALVIGDTAFDMEMAHSAGSAAIGVSWGYHPVEKLSGPNVRAVADDAEHLKSEILSWKAGENLQEQGYAGMRLGAMRAEFLYA